MPAETASAAQEADATEVDGSREGSESGGERTQFRGVRGKIPNVLKYFRTPPISLQPSVILRRPDGSSRRFVEELTASNRALQTEKKQYWEAIMLKDIRIDSLRQACMSGYEWKRYQGTAVISIDYGVPADLPDAPEADLEDLWQTIGKYYATPQWDVDYRKTRENRFAYQRDLKEERLRTHGRHAVDDLDSALGEIEYIDTRRVDPTIATAPPDRVPPRLRLWSSLKTILPDSR